MTPACNVPPKPTHRPCSQRMIPPGSPLRRGSLPAAHCAYLAPLRRIPHLSATIASLLDPSPRVVRRMRATETPEVAEQRRFLLCAPRHSVFGQRNALLPRLPASTARAASSGCRSEPTSAAPAVLSNFDFPSTQQCELDRRRLRHRVADRLHHRLGGFAGDLAELAHPVGAERKQHVCQSSHVA